MALCVRDTRELDRRPLWARSGQVGRRDRASGDLDEAGCAPRLRDRLGCLTQVVQVGWRGVEQHFMKLWRGHGNFNLLCVSGRSTSHNLVPSRDTVNNLRNGGMFNGRSIGDPVFDGGFGDFLASDALRGFLADHLSSHA